MIKEVLKIHNIVNIIQPLHLPIANKISNTHNNQRPQVDIFATNLSKSSRADQEVVFGEISYSYNLKNHIPQIQFFFKEVNCV